MHLEKFACSGLPVQPASAQWGSGVTSSSTEWANRTLPKAEAPSQTSQASLHSSLPYLELHSAVKEQVLRLVYFTTGPPHLTSPLINTHPTILEDSPSSQPGHTFHTDFYAAAPLHPDEGASSHHPNLCHDFGLPLVHCLVPMTWKWAGSS